MPSYTKTILGREISFRTDADPERVEKAGALLEQRYKMLNPGDGNIGKETLLTLVALGLADDLLLSYQKLVEFEDKMNLLLTKINTPR